MSLRCLVLGAGQGGLSAAVYARLQGWDVTVLEQRSVVGGKAAGMQLEGYDLDPGPSIIILKSIYDDVFAAAGRNIDDYLRFTALDPITRVLMEGRPPLDLPAGREPILAALAEAAPEDAEGLRSLLAKLDSAAPGIQKVIFNHPVEKFWQLADPRLALAAIKFDVKATYRQIVDAHLKSPLLRAFFYGFPSYSGQTYDAKAFGPLLIPYFMIQDGIWWPEGGVAAIPNAFRKLAEDLGVRFVTGVKVTEVIRHKNRVEGVRDSTGRQWPAERFICNIDRPGFGLMLGRSVPQRPSGSYFTLHWGIRREMPELSHHTLLVPANFEQGFEDLYGSRRPPESPIIYLNRTPSPKGTTCLFAVVTVPGLEDHIDWPMETERLRRVVRRSLDQFGLGFDDSEIDFERMQNPKYFEEEFGNWGGSLYGPDESERLWKMLPLRVKDEELINLSYCGGSVQPGAGLPMVTLSGKFAVDALS